MNILVLGGTMYMGIHLVNELLSARHDVTIATRGNAADLFGDKVNRLIVDRRNSDSLSAAFSGKAYDVVVDNLAYSSNDIHNLLDSVKTEKYVMTSTVSVYSANFHEKMRESEVDTRTIPLVWRNYDDLPYDEAKRQAEAALLQAYPSQPSAVIRFPYIFGKDDYTKRLFFYVEHIVNEKAINVDNIHARLSFINSAEAGRFLAHAATMPVFGCVNASSNGTISLEEIIRYTEERCGRKAVIQESGAPSPLNDAPSFSLDTTLAEQSGFEFMHLNDWVYALIDSWVDEMLRQCG